MKKAIMFFVIICSIFVACDVVGKTNSEIVSNNKEYLPFTDEDLAENGIDFIVWNGDSDKGFAVNIEAVQNNTRKNANGLKITSNAHSDVFPGIYFIWDSKQKDNGYLKVAGGIFSILDSFVLTSKEANSYWDFLIKPNEEQQMTDDDCFLFFIPKISKNKNINMVFLSEWVKKVDVIPSDLINATISISGIHNIAASSFNVAVILTLSDGEWINDKSYFLNKWESISEWVLFDDVSYLTQVNISPENSKVLVFAAIAGYQSKTVSINEEKLDEIKAATNITGTLTVDIKTAEFLWPY